jgi:Ca-activated chloride channel family protein
MNAYRNFTAVLILFMLATQAVFADGVMRPTNKSYPKDFLRHRMSKVDVLLTGQIAQTTVYQEFVNEWDASTDAVFSFPLPPDARATNFYFWSNDTMYRAVLRVKEQAPNPGIGEGGIDALLTTYLGPNSIKILLHDIPAGKLQRIQLEYLSLCPYFQGKVDYRYPLNTAQFTTYPVDDVSFSFRVESNEHVLTADLSGISPIAKVNSDDRHVVVSADHPKMYLTDDVLFSYSAQHDSASLDLYAAANDTMDGHFVMMLNPKGGGAGEDVLPKNMVFVLDRSSLIFGASLEASKAAISECIRRLQPSDSFSVVAFDFGVATWISTLAPATPTMVDSALAFIATLTISGGSALSSALTTSLSMFRNESANNIVLLFSDGKAVIDPKQIRSQNVKKAAILPVSVTTTAGRQRLEMLAYQNYGFPSFIAATDPVSDEVLRLFEKIRYPVWRDVRYEMGSNVYGLLPLALPTLYKGSRMYLTGRFKNPGTSTLSMAGFTVSGASFMDLGLTFPASETTNTFVEKFWAKEKIDDLERTIAVYGENDSLKQLLIKLSLGYGIRCKYTAYIADKNIVIGTDVEAEVAIESVSSERASNTVILRWKSSAPAKIREIHIYRKAGLDASFTLIATVAGTSTSYTDIGPEKTQVAYIVELVTTDGRLIRSQVISPSDIPASYSLEQNFPNPFNPATEIQFGLAASGKTTLEVYDVLGRKVATLLDNYCTAGSYRVHFDASALPSGVYIYRVSTPGFAATKRMLLMK